MKLVKEVEKESYFNGKFFNGRKDYAPSDLHIKIKGRYYPLLGKDGKLSVIDKVQGKKLSFTDLDKT